MKIGILTYFCGMNYGGQAQAYALTKVLEEMGHECCFIAHYPEKIGMKNLKMSLNIEPFWYKNIRQVCLSLIRMSKFAKFMKWQKKTKKIINGKMIDALGLDLVIVGSDEVLNCKHPFFSDIFVGVGVKKTPMLFYAPSSGALNVDYKLTDGERDSLERFIDVSARDKHTKSFLQNNVQRDVQDVVDPTMLYHFEELSKEEFSDKYLLLYSFDDLSIYKDKICEFARQRDCKVYVVGRYYSWADKSFATASVNTWISLFKNTNFVVTDSFHGMVFSIKNSKQFALLSRGDKVNKNSDLLETLSIDVEYWDGKCDLESFVQGNVIDYENVKERLQDRVYESKSYLCRNLERLRCK